MARLQPTYIEEPRVARWLFGSSVAAWVWLVARLWLGWEWFRAGWGKVFGGDLTWRVWDWRGHSVTGDLNVGWLVSGTSPDGRRLGVGDSVAGFAQGAIEGAQGPHPDVAYAWYVDFLRWIRDDGHPFVGPLVAITELVVGALLVLGLLTGIAAFVGLILNFSFVFAGSAGVNPAMIAVGVLLVLAWRNAGWWGLDRLVLPAVGTPWHKGRLRRPDEEAREPEPEAPPTERAPAANDGEVRREPQPVGTRAGGAPGTPDPPPPPPE